MNILHNFIILAVRFTKRITKALVRLQRLVLFLATPKGIANLFLRGTIKMDGAGSRMKNEVSSFFY